jgi:DNA repair exonuclease SbcCD ATPase subunit
MTAAATREHLRPDDIPARMSALKSNLQEIEGRRGALTVQRAKLSVASAEGDAEAKKQIVAIDIQEASLHAEINTLKVAIATLEDRQKDYEIQQRRLDRVRRVAIARGCAQKAVALSGEIDRALEKARQLLEQRNDALRELSGTQIVQGNYVQRLMSKGIVTSALRAAGLGPHCEIGHVEPSQVHPLAASSAGLNKIESEAS